MKIVTLVEAMQFANPSWSYAFCVGYVQGKAEALVAHPPTTEVWNALDEYAYGYRAAYSNYFQGTLAEHNAFLSRMYRVS